MKKVIVLLLALVLVLTITACGCKHEWLAATCENPKTCELCGETEGEAKGHSMVEATCEEAKHCENCNLVEGEPLGHTWLEATTEAPKTCETCGATEGERIITDERFTTAATKELQGKWVMEVPMTAELMGVEDFPEGASINFIMLLGNEGSANFSIEVTDGFHDALKQFTVDSMYAELAAQGMDAETADAAFADVYGMTIQEYVEEELSAIDMNQLFDAIFSAIDLGGVYYVEEDMIYTASNWEAPMDASEYTLEGDTLKIADLAEDLGMDLSFVRAAE